VGYDLSPLTGLLPKFVPYHHLAAALPFGLPFLADPRNLEIGKFTGIRRQEAGHVGF
jgi:hypothetical protein